MAAENPEHAASVLTPRQIEVLRLRAQALSMAEAGVELGITPHTVKSHWVEMRKQLSIANESKRGGFVDVRATVRVALELGLIRQEEVSPYILEDLSPHYHPILDLLSRGYTDNEITRELKVKRTTIGTKLPELYAFFGVKGIPENRRLRLAVVAKNRGFINTSDAVLEEGIEKGALVGKAYHCVFLRLLGYSYQEISEMLGVEQENLWNQMRHLSRRLGVATYGFWEENAINAAKAKGHLPVGTGLPSLKTGERPSGLEVALLHFFYERMPVSWEWDFEKIAQKLQVKPETIHGILRRACVRARISPDRPYAYLSAAEWMYGQRGNSKEFCGEKAAEYGL